MFIGVSVISVNAVAQGCCQLVWHSSTEEQGRQFTLNSAAVHWCLADCKSVGRVNVHRFKCHGCKCSGTRLLSAGLAQQHRRTRQAVYPKQCCCALLFGDCKSVGRVNLHRFKCHGCKCSGTRLLSAGLAQQHRRTRQAVYPKQCCCALLFGDCKSVGRVNLHRCKCHGCKCSGTRLLSAGLAQQHRRTRQAVYPKQCCRALVFG